MTVTRLRRLFQTSAMRLALRYALLNVLALAVALTALFVLLNRYVDRQIESTLRGEAAALASLPANHRRDSVRVLARLRGEERQVRFYRLEAAGGTALAGNVAAWPVGLAADGRLRVIDVQGREVDHDGEETLRLPAIALGLVGGGRLLVAQAPGALEDLREIALALAAGVLGLVALLSLALGVALGRRWLARIEAINGVAVKIAAGELSQRVTAGERGDEFDLLARHLNAMLARIEAAVAGMREVSDNVAHDLRKPLARLKTRIEVVLAQPRAADDYRAALAQTAGDADEIIRTFDALLSIARLESGSGIAAPENFDLVRTLQGVAELYADEAEDTGRSFARDLPASLHLRGQPALIRQAFANLLDNAFKHTPPGIAVEARLTEENGCAALAVIDHGAGIAPADKSRLIERFARGDAARSQPGSGLGLALVAAIAHAHGGTLKFTDTPGGGLTVRLLLPRA